MHFGTCTYATTLCFSLGAPLGNEKGGRAFFFGDPQIIGGISEFDLRRSQLASNFPLNRVLVIRAPFCFSASFVLASNTTKLIVAVLSNKIRLRADAPAALL